MSLAAQLFWYSEAFNVVGVVRGENKNEWDKDFEGFHRFKYGYIVSGKREKE